MKKNQKNSLGRLLVGFATLGTLFAASGCTSTVQVADNFRMPATTKTYINPGPLTVQVQTPVYYTRPVIYATPVVYGHGCYRPYRGGRLIYGPGRGVPTAGTHLGNTMRPFTKYYREYSR